MSTQSVFTSAGGAQIVLYEAYSAGTYVDTMSVGSDFDQPNVANRPTADTGVAPSGETLLSFDGNDLTGDFGTGGIIASGDFPAWSGSIFVVEHFILYLPSSPDNSTVMRMIDCGSDSWGRNFFGAGLVHKSGAISDSAMSGSTPYHVTIEHNVASGVSTMTVNGVAQTTTGSNSSSTRTDYLGYKLIGANGALGQAYVGHFGLYGIGHATTWGSTERAALYAAMDDWWTGAGADIQGTVNATLNAATASAAGSVSVRGALASAVYPFYRTFFGRNNKGLPAERSDASTLFQREFFSETRLKTLDAATVSSAGTVGSSGATGTVSQTLDVVTASAAGVVLLAGAASQTLAALAATAAGTVALVGSASVQLGDVTLVATGGAATALGTLAQTLADVTASAAGAVAVSGASSVTLDSLTVTSAGAVLVVGALTQALAAATSTSAGTVSVVGVLATTLATATSTSAGGVAIAGALAGTLAAATSSSAGVVSIVGALAKTLDALTLASIGDATEENSGSVAVTLASTSLLAEGQVTLSGALSSTLADVLLSSTGVQTNAGQLAVTLDSLGLESAALAAISGQLLVTLDALTAPVAVVVTLATISWVFGPANVVEVTGSVAGATIQFTQSALAVIAETQQLPATVITIEQTMTTLYVGDTNDIDFEFRDGHSNALVDPTALEISVQAPSETEPTVYVYGVDSLLTKRAVGQYRAAISCTEPGVWIFTIRSPGPTGKSAKPGSFDVEPVNT